MPLLNIDNTDVEFPFEPYSCQLAYMEKVIQCLKGRHNGILESPTGTGKTLNLLCASLAWLENEQRAGVVSSTRLTDTPLSGFDSIDLFAQAGKSQIIYTSRTHAQLLQAMKEFRRTAYAARFKAIALGARDHLCLNTSVLKETNSSVRIHMCRAKVSAKACQFHNNLDKEHQTMAREMCLDIEDLVKMGTKHTFCPYYMTKKLMPDFDIIFMPYNYVLTKAMRKANNIDLKNAIVIFDEAHNVHRVCEDASSIELTSSEIAMAIEELTQVGRQLSSKTEEENDVDSSSIWSPPVKGKGQGQNGSKEEGPQITFQEAMEMKKMLLDLESAIDGIPLEGNSQFSSDKITKQKSFDGIEIFDVFREASITFSTANHIIEVLSNAVDFLNKDSLNANQSSLFRSRGNSLSHIIDCIRAVFPDTDDYKGPFDRDTEKQFERSFSKEFKMHVAEIDSAKRGKKQDGGTITWDSVQTQQAPQNKGRCLSYWCLSASHAMRELPSMGVRSIILTSGTLSPLSSLAIELGLPFEVVFQNKHVINSNQCRLAVINKGPDRVELKATYQCRDSPEYVHSLGMLLLNMARRVSGGILVFFPSYTLLQSCISTWQKNQRSGLSPIFTLLNEVRRVIVEPHGKAKFSRVYEEYDTAIKERGGAILMAVCRGKASEGIDFSDYQSRLVVIVGLPYPPIFDPKVTLKMSYLDELSRKGTRLPTGEKMQLSGRQWYEQEAMRAVNQAIGRVIRHRWDYGYVVLADCRYGSPAVRAQLPKWLQSSFVHFDEVGKLLAEMSDFYRVAMLKIDQDPLAQRLFELTKNNSTISSSNPHGSALSQQQVACSLKLASQLGSPSALPCSQKPSPCCTPASTLLALYGSQAGSGRLRKEENENLDSIFSCLESSSQARSPLLASTLKSQISPVDSSSSKTSQGNSQAVNQRKRKFSVLSPPMQTAASPSGNVIRPNMSEKESRIREIAGMLPAEVRERLFRPFLVYRKTVSSTNNALPSLFSSLKSATATTSMTRYGKELLGLSDLIQPSHKEAYFTFLSQNNIKKL